MKSLSWCLFFLCVFTLNSQAKDIERKFDDNKYPDHYKQLWLFSTKAEAEGFLKVKSKMGWKGEVKEQFYMTPSQVLYFSESSDLSLITKLSEDLKKLKVPNNIISKQGSHRIVLGHFFDEQVLRLRQKKLFKNKVRAIRIEKLPESLNSVYALELVKKPQANTLAQKSVETLRHQRYQWSLLNESAYKPKDPASWAKIKNILRFASFNKLQDIEWKISFRLIYDAAFDVEDSFLKKVEEDQKVNFIPEDIYWKYFDNNWYLQLGYINIKWGNLIDTYVADVVSPKDLRDFILPRESSRDLPAIALKFNLNFEPHNFEVIWLPTPSVDKMSRYGSTFYPISSSLYAPNTLVEEDPKSLDKDMGYGIRWNVTGEDLAGSLFYLRSINREARFARTLLTGAIASVQQNHYPITRLGGTFDYTLDKYKFHFEGVYNQEDKVPTTLSNDVDGFVSLNNLHVGIQIQPYIFSSTNIVLQYVIKSYMDYTPDLMVDENEQYASVMIEKFFENSRWSPKITAHFGTQRGDSLIRPRIQWVPVPNLNLILGYDLFEGDSTGQFGQFSMADRYYIETEYIF
ncbi:MAG: hypothetical protein H6625_08410 [Bdellovibrionaceae bacterium]|nr:hypothetical protein [Pseudobdellovibrionaceae bacterium]